MALSWRISMSLSCIGRVLCRGIGFLCVLKTLAVHFFVGVGFVAGCWALARGWAVCGCMEDRVRRMDDVGVIASLFKVD